MDSADYLLLQHRQRDHQKAHQMYQVRLDLQLMLSRLQHLLILMASHPYRRLFVDRYLKFEFGYLSKKWYLSLQMLDRLARCLQNQGEV